MNITHTTGPWKTLTYVPGQDENGDDFEPQWAVRAANADVCSGIQIDADARLIAAAPDLLAALAQIERLSREADRKLVNVPAMLGDIARAAIAKATGQ